MSTIGGIIVVGACVAAILLAPTIKKLWDEIPVDQCPRCFSYNVREDLEDETVLHCQSCQNEWRPEE